MYVLLNEFIYILNEAALSHCVLKILFLSLFLSLFIYLSIYIYYIYSRCQHSA